jgi:hypothetical protein
VYSMPLLLPRKRASVASKIQSLPRRRRLKSFDPCAALALTMLSLTSVASSASSYLVELLVIELGMIQRERYSVDLVLVYWVFVVLAVQTPPQGAPE